MGGKVNKYVSSAEPLVKSKYINEYFFNLPESSFFIFSFL